MEPVADFCVHGDETSGFVKGGKFPDWKRTAALAYQEGLCSV
jgi:hypothetical protein